MRIAISGLGSIGKRHARNLLADASEFGITGLKGYDKREDRREEARSIEGLEVLDDPKGLFAGCDLAYICVPTAIHLPVANEAIEAGCHLFIEKPLNGTIEGVGEMLSRAEAAGRMVAVGYFLRFHPVVMTAKRWIDEGRIGKVLSARVEVGQYLPDWHPHEDYRSFYMAHADEGGGALLDMSHEFDMLHWILGEPEWCSGFFSTVSNLDITSDDLVEAIFGFSGAVGSAHLDLLDRRYHRGGRWIGTDGTIETDLAARRTRLLLPGGEEEEEEFTIDIDDLYRDQNRCVIEAARSGDEPPVSGSEGRVSLEMVEAVRRSSASGERIALPLVV